MSPPRARSRLRKRLTLLLVLPVLLSLLVLGVTVISAQRALLFESTDRALEGHLRTLHATAAVLHERGHRDELVQVIHRLHAGEGVHGIVIYDREGRAIAEGPAADHRAADAIAAQVIATGTMFHDVISAGGRDVLLRVERAEEGELGAIAVHYDVGFERAAARRELLLGAAVGGACILVLALAAAWLARRLGTKLGGLVHGAELVAAGDLSARVDEAPLLELEQVSRAFNRMIEALADARRRLDESLASHRELERRIRRSEALAIVGQVASSFAHEIGSPLSTILGWARLGSEDEALPEDTRAHFETIASQCDRIRRVVERMLQVARPAADDKTRVDLAEVVREVFAFLAFEAKRKGIDLRLLLADRPPPIDAVRDQILEVVMNLAVNAIRAQPEGGVLRVTLSTERDDGDEAAVRALRLEVADAGPGIPEADRALVFEPFYSTRRATGGTGLGLSIVADVVRGLGGKVSVERAPEGGALFQLRLPIAEP